LLVERDDLLVERDGLLVERDDLLVERDGLLVERDEVFNSRLWKITKPYRVMRSRMLKHGWKF
jgi:hypothetical protein